MKVMYIILKIHMLSTLTAFHPGGSLKRNFQTIPLYNSFLLGIPPQPHTGNQMRLTHNSATICRIIPNNIIFAVENFFHVQQNLQLFQKILLLITETKMCYSLILQTQHLIENDATSKAK